MSSTTAPIERPRISACIIAFNEAGRIGDCLASLAFCDEIVVVDSYSTDATVAIADAQRRVDTYAVAAYVNGPSASYLTAADPDSALQTAAAGQALAANSQQVLGDLQAARTDQVNRESAARLAKQNADRAAAVRTALRTTATRFMLAP